MFKVLRYFSYFFKIVFFIFFIVKGTEALAATNMNQDIKGSFKGSFASLGYFLNTGDTSTQALNAKILVSYFYNENWLTVGTLNYDTSTDRNGMLLSNKLYAEINSVRYLDNRSGIYGNINYTHDTFSGYQYIMNESIGYSLIIRKTNDLLITGQAGPGLQQRKVDSSGDTDNLLAGNLSLQSRYKINKMVNWNEKLMVTVTKNNTLSSLDSSVDTNLFRNTSLKVGYLISYDTNPLPTKYKFNSQTMVFVVYSI